MTAPENPTTLVLLSGGMNSAALLFDLIRIQNRPVMEVMTFNTDRPTNEHMPAMAMANRAGVPISLWNHNVGPFMDVGPEGQPDIPQDFGDAKLELVMMLLNAAYRAKQRGFLSVVTGHLQSELFGMTSDEFVHTIDVVTDYTGIIDGTISAPWWHWKKEDIFWYSKNMNVLGEITAYTTSCLEGNEETLHRSWGYGCGECRGCKRRAAAWALYLERLKG